MAARPLIHYPDPRLRIVASPVDQGDPTVSDIAGDVLDTLDAAGAFGLTAVHIGHPVRVVVLRLRPDQTAVTYVNPEVLWTSPETTRHDEGSVSMPGIIEPVVRPARIRLRTHDLSGDLREEEVAGFEAACLLHEIDQLDGIFWIDRLSRVRRERALRRFAKRRRGS